MTDKIDAELLEKDIRELKR